MATHEFIQQSNVACLLQTEKMIVCPCSTENKTNFLLLNWMKARHLFNLDLTYVNENRNLSRGMLEGQIVTETLVTSITTLNNKVSLPCAVEYSAKKARRVATYMIYLLGNSNVSK